eukprot:6211716-Pleurochrysis_carterae.AAC.1
MRPALPTRAACSADASGGDAAARACVVIKRWPSSDIRCRRTCAASETRRANRCELLRSCRSALCRGAHVCSRRLVLRNDATEASSHKRSPCKRSVRLPLVVA